MTNKEVLAIREATVERKVKGVEVWVGVEAEIDLLRSVNIVKLAQGVQAIILTWVDHSVIMVIKVMKTPTVIDVKRITSILRISQTTSTKMISLNFSLLMVI